MDAISSSAFFCSVRGDKEGVGMACVQLINSVSLLDAVDGASGSVYLRRPAAKGGDNAIDVDRLKKRNNRTAAGKWLGGIFFESTLSTVHGIRADTAAHSVLQ